LGAQGQQIVRQTKPEGLIFGLRRIERQLEAGADLLLEQLLARLYGSYPRRSPIALSHFVPLIEARYKPGKVPDLDGSPV
jgi:hypothetical protein